MFSVLSSPAFSGPLTCWYNDAGQSTGADSGDRGLQENQYGKLVNNGRPGTDYAYILILTEWNDGNACPRVMNIEATKEDTKESLPSMSASQETCGNNADLNQRSQGCSDLISNPLASTTDVTWALWSRAYVRCGNAPDNDVISDLMMAARLDTKEWQEYFRGAGGYTGAIDGQMNVELYKAVSRYVKAGCR